MSSQPLSPKQFWVAQQQQAGIAVSDELLQKADDPIADLKGQPDRIAVVVPYEYLWPEALKPGTNPTHKRMYDADLLAEHLEAAGYHSHVLRVIDFQGWTWLSAIGVRILNSAEKRRLKRVNLQNRDRPTVEEGLKPPDVVPDSVGQKGSN